MGVSWLRPLLSDQMFNQEFAPQQAARVVRNAAQPLLFRELAFAARNVGRREPRSRLRPAQRSRGISAGLGCVVRLLLLAARARLSGRGGRLTGLRMTWLGLGLRWPV